MVFENLSKVNMQELCAYTNNIYPSIVKMIQSVW